MPSYLSPSRMDALNRAQEIFRVANLHMSSQLFRASIREDFGFYQGGVGQWLSEDLDILKERGQVPLTVRFCEDFSK